MKKKNVDKEIYNNLFKWIRAFLCCIAMSAVEYLMCYGTEFCIQIDGCKEG